MGKNDVVDTVHDMTNVVGVGSVGKVGVDGFFGGTIEGLEAFFKVIGGLGDVTRGTFIIGKVTLNGGGGDLDLKEI